MDNQLIFIANNIKKKIRPVNTNDNTFPELILTTGNAIVLMFSANKQTKGHSPYFNDY